MFRKILIANRGEIAVRVLRTCRALEIPTVAVYSDADRTALHVLMADEAVRIGPAPAQESYLRIDAILDAARKTGAEAIHPGYGFLSENAAFARACADAGVVFIGPPPEAMDAMGSKTAARRRMQAAGVPVVPGTTEPLRDAAEALPIAAAIGYPVMLKAAAGGGGKGMRLVHDSAELAPALERAVSEAERAFGDGSVYLEKAIVQPRHVEVQILADHHGACIHLGERECSLQRRHQKVIEETPSPLVGTHQDVRDRLTSAAIDAALAVGYSNAGTVEFLMDGDRNFYFLEMNTRLQVEHPVTEMVSGVDLVREQIHVAAGRPLRYTQDQVAPRGWAMECRIYAEDPDQGFMPSPGRLERYRLAEGPSVRADSGAYEGWEVPMEYDPLLAKLSAWGPTREEAIDRLRAAVDECRIAGVRTPLELYRRILRDESFRRGEIDTGWLGRFASPDVPADTQADAAALAASVIHSRTESAVAGQPVSNGSNWKRRARQAGDRR
ncbi:MAG: acetyl-CoA carboxylase biotin carboxylase subunit [Acidobacteria bacterium]|nr:acetyl-CoA carboxylase biotin carboxylase subunit [Acidobacteriota bacterium]